MLDHANKKNPHGGGFAYIKDGLVHWEKGMHVNAKYVAKYVKKHKLTAKNKLIVHFRIATHGEVNNMMCHPFPLGLDKSGQAVKNKPQLMLARRHFVVMLVNFHTQTLHG